MSAIKPDEFNNISRVILASFGFITGKVAMDYGYFFSYSDNTSKFESIKFDSTFIGTYNSQYSIVNLNGYDYYQNEDLKINVEAGKDNFGSSSFQVDFSKF